MTPLFLFMSCQTISTYYLGPLATLADNFFFIIDLYIGNRPVVVHLDFAVLFIYYNGIPFSQSLNHSLTHFFYYEWKKEFLFFFKSYNLNYTCNLNAASDWVISNIAPPGSPSFSVTLYSLDPGGADALMVFVIIKGLTFNVYRWLRVGYVDFPYRSERDLIRMIVEELRGWGRWGWRRGCWWSSKALKHW